MAEGGTLPWKRQVIDSSRGPAGSYREVHQALPDLPDGVAWHQNPETREWTLVRVDQQQQDRDRQLYQLERTTVWNARTGREQLSVKPVLKTSSSKNNDDNYTVVTNVSDDDDDGNDMDKNSPPTPVLGKDYVVHTVLPSDTFAGLCLRYKIKAVQLRRINHFSGTILALAPSKLLIPLGNGVSLDSLKLQDVNSPEYKMQVILNEFPSLAVVERKAYLEMNDWDMEATKDQIRQDMDWERHQAFEQAVPLAEQVKNPKSSGLQPLEVETK